MYNEDGELAREVLFQPSQIASPLLNCLMNTQVVDAGINLTKNITTLTKEVKFMVSEPDSGEEDFLDFLDEDEGADAVSPGLPAWKILIVDDDSNVHETTILALTSVKILGRSLELMHAYSAREAQEVIRDVHDIALVLLDVVMETVDAGLNLVNIIRNDMHRHDLKIVLRTGQPGYAPEQSVTDNYAIDGYTTKSRLTRNLLINVITDALSQTGTRKQIPN